MVEPYIRGLELAVAVMGESKGPRGLAVTEIRSSTGFYDYEAKYSEGGSIHCPAGPDS
jgi:D-alanine-D-alanine ligase